MVDTTNQCRRGYKLINRVNLPLEMTINALLPGIG